MAKGPEPDSSKGMPKEAAFHPDKRIEAAESAHRPVAGLVLAAAFSAVLVTALLAIPREQAPLPAIARYAMLVAIPQWKITEPVNEVVYGTRGFDTFGETFLLLAAVVAIGTLSRAREARRGFIGEELAAEREQGQVDPAEPADAGEQKARRAEKGEQGTSARKLPDFLPLGTPGPESAEAMTVVVRGAVRVGAPVLLVVGLYVVAWGYSPGGGFPAGAAIVGVILFAYAAYGYNKVEAVIRPDVIEPIEMSGALAIVAVEALGLIIKGSFSASWAPLAQLGTPLSGGVLQLFSVSELVEVATGLTLVLFGLLSMTHDWTPDEGHDEQRLAGPAGRPGAGERP
jgi:multicomponent Na+:H+ antiporter subunit B